MNSQESNVVVLRQIVKHNLKKNLFKNLKIGAKSRQDRFLRPVM